MCGIVGYVGRRDCTDVLIDALSKLEYRGYDSAGIAVFTKNGIEVSFYTPFAVKGLFKKTINVEKSILAEIKENVFD